MEIPSHNVSTFDFTKGSNGTTCVEKDGDYHYQEDIKLFEIPEVVTHDTIIDFNVSDVREGWEVMCSICGVSAECWFISNFLVTETGTEA